MDDKARIAALEAQLAEAERFRFIVESAPYGIDRTDAQANFIYANRACAEILGYDDPAELIGKNLQDFIVKEDLPKSGASIPIIEEQGFWRGRVRIRRADGKVTPIEVAVFDKKDADGNITDRIGLFRDISQEAELEQQKETQTQRIQSLYNMSHDLNTARSADELLLVMIRPAIANGAHAASLSYIDTDAQGSPAWSEMAAMWQRGELQSPVAPGRRFYIPDQATAQLWLPYPDEPQIFPDLKNDPRLADIDTSAFERAGVRANCVVPLTHVGRWVGVLNIVWNEPHTFSEEEVAIYKSLSPLGAAVVHNRRMIDHLEAMVERRTQELQENEARWRLLIEGANEAITVIDLEGKCIITNKAAAVMLGTTPEEIIGKTIYDMFPSKEVGDKAMARIERIRASGQSETLEMPHQIEGQTRWMRSITQPVRDDAGSIIAVMETTTDITEVKEAEEAHARLQQEIIESQQQAIAELSSPIIPIMENIIILPLIGTIDSSRARSITRALLAGISQYRARIAILDITGVPVVDSGVAGHLDKTIQAARLKGAHTIVTGISDAVAETIVDLGIDWSEIDTMRDLQTGLRAALAELGKSLG